MIKHKLDANHRHKHEDHLVADGCEHAARFYLEVGRDTLRNQVKAVGVVAVSEIINVVPCHRIDSIIEGTHVGSLARTREIGLQRRRTRIKITHTVSIIAP